MESDDEDRHSRSQQEVLDSVTVRPAGDIPPAGLLPLVSAEVAVFVALADPTRRRLLEVLVDIRRASATALADHLPVSRQAVVKHLHVLEAAGLVGAVRTGREVIYVARPEPLNASARWLADLSAAWHRRLERAVGPMTDVGRRREPS
jgi:DNA-binding transcriptional ArsR family regulator